jgi:hypothetical protein
MKSPIAKGDGRLFTVLRNNSLFCATALKIEDGVSGTSLREEGLLWFQLDDSSSQASFGQKRESVKCHFLRLCHLNDPFQKSITPGQFRRAYDRFSSGLTAGIFHPF